MSRHTSSMPLFDRPAQPAPTVQCNPTVADADRPRLTASLQRLLNHMRPGQWCTSAELIEVAGYRYGGRLHELARAGIPHEGERVAGGQWRYRLIGSPTNGVGTDGLSSGSIQ